MRTRRSGYTLVEVAIVMLIVSILARVALPKIGDMMYRARAAEALSVIQNIRLAAHAYNTEHHGWPPDQPPGVVPQQLLPYLGDGFSFETEHYQLDWDNWVLPDGSPKHPETGVLLGVSLVTQDEDLGHALEELVGQEQAHWTLNDNYTFVIAAM